MSGHVYLEAAPGALATKTPEWKFWCVGTETMSVEIGLWARAMSNRKGHRGGDVTTGQKAYKPGSPMLEGDLNAGGPFIYS